MGKALLAWLLLLALCSGVIAFDYDAAENDLMLTTPPLDGYSSDDAFSADLDELDDEGEADDAYQMRFAAIDQAPQAAPAVPSVPMPSPVAPEPVASQAPPAVQPSSMLGNVTVDVDPFGRSDSLDTTHKSVQYGPPQLLPEDLDMPARCISWGYPQSMISFDSNRFRFDGQGEFILYRHRERHEEVRVLQRRAGRVSFNYAVAFLTGDDVAVIHLGPATNGMKDSVVPYVLVNGNSVDYERIPAIMSFAFLAQGSFEKNTRIISVRNDAGTRVAVTFAAYNGLNHLNVFLQVTGDKWNATSGLCGTFDLNPSNEMLDGDGNLLNNVQSFAAAWGQNAANSAVFPTSVFEPDQQETILLQGPALSVDLAVTKSDLEKAQRVCASFDLDERQDCERNVLIDGIDAVEEVASINIIANEGVIVVDSEGAQCIRQRFALADWTTFADCSVTCGHGTQNRTRDILLNGTMCGRMYQLRSCEQNCEHVRVWGKCVAYGDVHFATFDRDFYDYQGTGEYIMYHHYAHHEQINLMLYKPNPVTPVSYASGVAFRYGNDVFSVQLLPPTYDQPIFRYNTQYIHLSSQRAMYGFFTVMKSGSFGSKTERFIIEVKIPGGTRLTINFQRFKKIHQLTAYIEVAGAKISETEGLCGNFDFNSTNDRMNRTIGVVTDNTTEVGWSHNVFANNSLFTDTFPLPSLPLSDLVTARNVTQITRAQYRNIRAICLDLPMEFRPACQLDIVMGGLRAIEGVRDVKAVIGDHMYSAQAESIWCLKQPGTTLGNPTAWTSVCSTKCGPGVLTRDRRIRLANTTDCGVLQQSKSCEIQPCPVDCLMGEWAAWGECSTRCGQGTQSRSREVLRKERYGGQPCKHTNETQLCKEKDCCQFTPWADWGSCQSGIMARTRDLVTGTNTTCGPLREVKACCDISQWSEWSPCSKGFRHRRREVVGLPTCGHKVERVPCCEVGGWSDWSMCHDGVETRTRDIVGDANCGLSVEKRTCCEVREWSEWSECGNGTQSRRRVVVGDATCPDRYPHIGHRDCCVVGNWSDWTTCDDGFQFRERLVVGNPTCGVSKERRACCRLEQWTPWGPCDGGRQRRTRLVVGLEVCGRSVEEMKCCEVKEWSDWTACLSDGFRHRSRVVNGHERCHWEHPKKQKEACCLVGSWTEFDQCSPGQVTKRTRIVKVGSDECKAKTETVETKPCCTVGDWSEWGVCQADGKSRRQRSVVGFTHLCATQHNAVEEKDCCLVGEWTSWTSCQTDGYSQRTRVISGAAHCPGTYLPIEKKPCCSAHPWSDWSSCDEGIMTRSRNIEGPPTCGQPTESRACCEYSEWSDWSQCINGMVSRKRAVMSAAICNGTDAVQLYQQKACCVMNEWGPWSPCALDGTQKRERSVGGHARCDNEMPAVQTQRCCNVGRWSGWSECSNGNMRRDRVVTGSDQCLLENPALENQDCCQVGVWGAFGSCNGGHVSRSRTVIGNSTCHAHHHSSQIHKCCVVGPWNTWTCSADKMTMTRSRKVDGHADCLREYPATQSHKCIKSKASPAAPPTAPSTARFRSMRSVRDQDDELPLLASNHLHIHTHHHHHHHHHHPSEDDNEDEAQDPDLSDEDVLKDELAGLPTDDNEELEEGDEFFFL